ncbi:Cnot4 [Drosophila busckii]|uniref:Cnot4 n=1 Tax=Drosophila busckii TaxID=30019 RepID=A0A0M3QTN3_DROBS|nr:Cnot4 [Drosophila busckii]
MIAFKSQKRQRDQQRKQKITENRKHLANVRVVQKNLVFVVGLPPRLADADILKKHEYFGKYGKIHKVVINPSTTYAGVQGPSASAYVTYVHNADALRAIQSVNNIMIDGRLIKTSLGTTKYCSHFMKNQQCPKGDCMYLHDLGDSEASFTKEEMHQGKHQEYEKRLHDALIAASGANNIAGIVGSANSSIVSGNGTSKTNASVTMSSSSSTSSVSTANTSSSVNAQKEAWPSLSISPINTKDVLGNVTTVSGKSKKDKSRNEKGRHEKSKAKSKNNVCLTSNTSNKENYTPEKIPVSIDTTGTTTSSTDLNAASSQHKTERNKDKGTSRTAISKDQNKTKDNVESSENNKQLQLADDDLNPNKIKSSEKMFSLSKRSANNTHRSPSSSSENSDDHVSESSVSENSTPDSFSNARSSVSHTESKKETSLKSDADKTSKNMKRDRKTTELDSTKLEDSINKSQEEIEKFDHSKNDCTNEMSDALSKLNVFDDSNSFFSSSNAFQQPSILRNKVDGDIRQSQMSPVPTSHLPDLLNGYSNSDWTAMDPAILSFRQFSSFPHQGPMPLHQQDFFLQQLAQQPPQQQQNGTGFNNQTQQMLGMNLTNNLISGQSPSMTQVNANVQGMLEFLKTRQFV